MILSRTSQYAIQALIYIATQPRGELILKRELAKQLNLPPTYLAKILGDLCSGGLLYSTRGRRGGFCLRENVEHADLLRVLCLTEGAAFSQGCGAGFERMRRRHRVPHALQLEAYQGQDRACSRRANAGEPRQRYSKR